MDNKEEQPIEMVSFEIIANAGEARSLAFQALDEAKQGHFDVADELMKKSDESATLAHKAQTDFSRCTARPFTRSFDDKHVSLRTDQRNH